MDGSPPGSSAHGTSQARILEWVATSSSRVIQHEETSYIPFMEQDTWTLNRVLNHYIGFTVDQRVISELIFLQTSFSAHTYLKEK